MSYDDLSNKLGLTNTYTAQLLLGQAKLTSDTAIKLQGALPSVSPKDISDMQSSFPMRSFDDQIMKEPNVYRTYEAITHVSPSISNLDYTYCGILYFAYHIILCISFAHHSTEKLSRVSLMSSVVMVSISFLYHNALLFTNYQLKKIIIYLFIHTQRYHVCD